MARSLKQGSEKLDHLPRTWRSWLTGAVAIVLVALAVAAAACQQETPAATSGVPETAAVATKSDGLPTALPPSSTPSLESKTPATATQQKPTAATEGPAAGELVPTVEPTTSPTAEPLSTETAEPTAAISPTAAPTDQPEDFDWPVGALIDVQMDGTVGVLLDELPEDARDSVAQALISRPPADWVDLAHRQVKLTERRLNFRNFNYPGRGQLPLPPEELWSFEFISEPQRATIQGHDLVTADYLFTSTLLSDIASVPESEPNLASAGGVWEERFVLPLDPDLLLQRTGNACINEAGFPPNSFDSENTWVFFDFACQAGSAGPLGCHRTQLPPQSCIAAMQDAIGTFETQVRFERLEWDAALAEEVRVGEVTQTDAPDLKVVEEDLANYRAAYKYFPADSCALLEQCVSDSGWRRVLQFDATVHNVGGRPLHIGPVVTADPDHNLFQYNACHDHYHFSDYGDFFFADAESTNASKQAFCVESTGRLSNNEFSPLTHNYRCSFQGVQAGWIDEYVSGLDCQWIDITDVELGDALEEPDNTVTLGFLSNPDRFLCEGTPLLDDQGNRLWEDSELTAPDGHPVQRPQCEFIPDWDSNNLGLLEIPLAPVGSFVTEPCQGSNNGGHLGPKRNCGFSQQGESIQAPEPGDDGAAVPFNLPGGGYACDAGEMVQLTCGLESGSDPQTLRICEYSEVLDTGLACPFEDALANTIVGSQLTVVQFTCPLPRDESESGASFSLYTSPLIGSSLDSGDDSSDDSPVSCTIDN